MEAPNHEMALSLVTASTIFADWSLRTGRRIFSQRLATYCMDPSIESACAMERRSSYRLDEQCQNALLHDVRLHVDRARRYRL